MTKQLTDGPSILDDDASARLLATNVLLLTVFMSPWLLDVLLNCNMVYDGC